MTIKTLTTTTILTIALLTSCSNKEIKKEFYPSGKIKSESETENGKANGKTTTYYENGKIEMEAMLKDDSLIDNLKFYHPNGMPSLEVNIKTLEGISYSEDGLMIEKGNIIRGKKNGLWTEYVRASNLKRFLWTYVDDVKTGDYVCYAADGSIEVKGIYKNGTLDGPLYYFSSKGDTTKVQYWKADANFASSTMTREEIK